MRSHCEFPGSWPLKGDLCAESLLGLPWGLMSGGSRLGGGSSWSTEQSQASANLAGSLELESLQSRHPLKQGLQNPPRRGSDPRPGGSLGQEPSAHSMPSSRGNEVSDLKGGSRQRTTASIISDQGSSSGGFQ